MLEKMKLLSWGYCTAPGKAAQSYSRRNINKLIDLNNGNLGFTNQTYQFSDLKKMMKSINIPLQPLSALIEWKDYTYSIFCVYNLFFKQICCPVASCVNVILPNLLLTNKGQQLKY